MPAFEYKALNASGKEVKGVLEGDNARQVRQQLRNKNLTPLSVDEGSQKQVKSQSGRSTIRGGIKTAELALMIRQIATLVASGTPIEEALSAVSRQTEKQRTKTLLLSVRSKVLEGHSLAVAMGDYPKIFPEMFRATVAAGEQSGHLDAVLERLADYTEDRQSVKQTINKAVMYPAALIIAAVGIVWLLLAFVVPQVIQVFDSLNQELPTLTQLLIQLSEFIQEWGLAILLSIVALIYLARRAMLNEEIKYRVHSVLLRMPIIGKLIRGMNSAQFARTLSILAASGVPVLEALDIASQVLTNRPMRKAVKIASEKVREGSSLSRSLEQSGLFPPMMLHLIASGESSGKLDSMLEKAASHQEREMDSLLTIFLGLFEPMIILIMGGVIMTIVLAILLPIFELNQMVN